MVLGHQVFNLMIRRRKMEFFKKTWVKIVAWILWVLATVVLVMGGISAEGLSSVLTAVLGIVSAIAALITLISSLIKKKE
jgi:polyferredoxin